MLTKEENELLTSVGRGTPGGELLEGLRGRRNEMLGRVLYEPFDGAR